MGLGGDGRAKSPKSDDERRRSRKKSKSKSDPVNKKSTTKSKSRATKKVTNTRKDKKPVKRKSKTSTRKSPSIGSSRSRSSSASSRSSTKSSSSRGGKKSRGRSKMPEKKSKMKKTPSMSSLRSIRSTRSTRSTRSSSSEAEKSEKTKGVLAKPEKTDEVTTTRFSLGGCDQNTSTNAYCPPCGTPKSRNLTLTLPRDQSLDDEDRQAQARLCIDRLSNERDYYRAEFERLLKFFEKLSSAENEFDDNSCIACQKKQQLLEFLQRENEVLSKEKSCLMSRIQEIGDKFSAESPTAKCTKQSCKRVERERDLLKFDIQRLEEETDCLREKLKTLGIKKTQEYAKFQEQRIEYENTISKLEGERRELMKTQGLRRVTINALEEKVDMFQNLLRIAQEEVTRKKTQYCQLKKLHEQCDKALLDTQAQLVEVEAELSRLQTKDKTLKDKTKKKGKSVQAFSSRCLRGECLSKEPQPQPLPNTNVIVEHSTPSSDEREKREKRIQLNKEQIEKESDDLMNKLKQLDKEKDENADLMSRVIQLEKEKAEKEADGLKRKLTQLDKERDKLLVSSNNDLKENDSN